MLRSLVSIGVLQFAAMVFLLARTKVLAVLLGPELLGVMAVVDRLIAVVAQTASFSLPFAALRFLPSAWSEGPAQYSDLYGRMRNTLVLTTVGATLFGVAVTAYFPALWGQDLSSYQAIVFVGFLGLPAAMFVPFLKNAIAGRLEHNGAMLFGLAHAAVMAATAIAGAWWGGLRGVYLAYAIGGLGLVVAAATWIRSTGARRLPGEARQFLIGLPLTVYKFSLAMLSVAFLTPFAALYLSYRVLSDLGAADAGLMQAAIGISIAIRTVFGTVNSVFVTPNVNRGGTFSERMVWANNFQRTLALVCALVSAPLLLFPDLAIRLLYSAEFTPAAQFVTIFVLAELVGLSAGVYQSLVVAYDHLAFHVVLNVIAQVALLLAAVLLIRPYGIAGLGVAWFISYLTLGAGTVAFLRIKHGLTVPWRVAATTGVALSILALTGAYGSGSPGLQLGTTMTKMLAYLGMVGTLSLFLTSAERTRLYAIGRSGLAGLRVWRAP